MIKRVALPPYAPDQSNNSGVLLKAENVFPAQDGYRSIGEVLTVSDALAAGFIGGYSAVSSDGTAFLLAGTTTNLYRLATNGSWTSLIGSLTVQRWEFAQFGDYVIAVTGSDTIEVDLGGATASVLAPAPSGNSIAVVGDYLVIGQPDGDVNKIAWSAFRDHTGWTPGTNQSGEQPMQTGGTVAGIAGGEYGIILQRERIVRMTRTGDSTAPFQFDEISNNFGCAAGATIAQAGRTVFFRSDRGFMGIEADQLKPIGSEKVDRTFDGTVSRDDYQRMFTAVDPQNKLVMWGVPGSPGTVWIYNFELDRWSTASFAFEGVMPGFTNSIGLDDLPGLGYTNIDTMTITLDDPRWQGGNPRLYLFDTAHKLGTLHGDKLAAEFELGFNEFAPGRRARLRSVRPVWDGTTGMTMTVNAKARLGDNDNTFSTSTLRNSGVMPVRSSGRYIATKVAVAAAVDWDYIQSLDFEFEAGGIR